MSRFTLNIQANSAADLQKALRSAAAKISADDLTPGADVKVGNVRIQVATPQVQDIRQFALDNGIPVGKRGRYSKDLQERYAAHLKAQRAEKRAAAAARKAAKSEELVSA